MIHTKSTWGWILYDFANSAYATIVLAVIFNQYFAGVIAGPIHAAPFDIPYYGSVFLCVIPLPGAALWNFLVAASTAIVAISSPLLGAAADHASRKKRLLVVYCYLGVFMTMGLYFTDAGDIVLAAVLFILANLGFAGGNVFYNAFLVEVGDENSYGKLSGLSWGLGYLGGGLCLALCLVLLKFPMWLGLPEGSFTVGHCMIIAGIWWGVFALPTVLWLKESQPENPEHYSIYQLLSIGWKRITDTLREVRKYKELGKFLLAYLIFNDGIETVIIMASIFGAQVIGLAPFELVAFFILIQLSGLAGSFLFGWLADIITNKAALLVSILIWLIIVLWAYHIGWLLDPRRDFFIIGILAGIVMGGSQTVARAMQASFTPKEKTAEFFGFYAVSGRFASIFGPLIYGVAILVSGGIRSGILALGVFFIVGGGLLFTVNESKGRIASKA